MTARIHNWFKEFATYIVGGIGILFILYMAWFGGEVKAIVREELKNIKYPYSLDSARIQMQITTVERGLTRIEKQQTDGFLEMTRRLDRILENQNDVRLRVNR